MLAELLLTALLDTVTCADLPAHPQEPASETLLMNGLLELTFDVVDVDSGRPMVVTEWYRVLDVDTSRSEEAYQVEVHPMVIILTRAGYADAVWVDWGGGTHERPRGFCSEMHRQ